MALFVKGQNINNENLPIPLWWQLPFALALSPNRCLPTRCRLCRLHLAMPLLLPPQTHVHWFNQIGFLCTGCHNSLTWQASQFKMEVLADNGTGTTVQTFIGIASSFYQFPYNQIIRRFKNQHDLAQLALLINAIRQMAIPPNCHSHNSVIVAVPTTTKRLTERGFDPMTILASYLSFHWQIPIFPHIIRQDRQKQQGLSRAERLMNAQQVFDFTHLPKIPNVILFDDVATTGATLQSLAHSLMQASESRPKPYKIHIRALAHGSRSP